MQLTAIPPRARWALLFVSLSSFVGCASLSARAPGRPGAPATAAVSPLVTAPELTCSASADEPAAKASLPHGNPTARAGAARGIAFVAREAVAWQNKNQCYGCHVQAVTLEALAIGQHNQYEIPKAELSTILRGLTEISGGARGPNGLSLQGGQSLLETSKEFGGAAFSRYDALVGPEVREDLMRVAAELTSFQEPDGSLRTSDTRFPVEAGLMQSTTQALQTFRQAYERSADERWLAPIRKAEEYLKGRALALSDDPGAGIVDLNYAAIGLSSAGAQGGEGVMRAIAARLRRLQRQDGAFGFNGQDEANAFATGQTLYALRLLGASDDDAAVTRGTAWLLAHQGSDGGWSHEGRGKAEAMWAVLGLVSVDVLSLAVTGVEDGQHVQGRLPVRVKAADNSGRGVARVEVAIDDVPVHRACGASAELAIDADKLDPGVHLIDVTAQNARGQASRRRLTVYAGAYYLTQIGTRFGDGGTLISLRDVAPKAVRGDVVLRVFATREDDGRTARAAEVFRSTQASAEGPMTFFWDGSRSGRKAKEPAGRYIAELSFIDPRGGAVQHVEVPFVHDTPEAQHATFGEVAGALSVGAAAPAANTRIDLVDEQGRVVQSTVTTEAGNYRFRNVDRGRYKVRVVKKGFQKAEADVSAAPARAAMPAPMNLQAQ